MRGLQSILSLSQRVFLVIKVRLSPITQLPTNIYIHYRYLPFKGFARSRLKGYSYAKKSILEDFENASFRLNPLFHKP